jgi:hypothetical protein
MINDGNRQNPDVEILDLPTMNFDEGEGEAQPDYSGQAEPRTVDGVEVLPDPPAMKFAQPPKKAKVKTEAPTYGGIEILDLPTQNFNG